MLFEQEANALLGVVPYGEIASSNLEFSILKAVTSSVSEIWDRAGKKYVFSYVRHGDSFVVCEVLEFAVGVRNNLSTEAKHVLD